MNIDMANIKITAAIVVYNKEISESITCQRIKEIDSDIDILVLDNSDKKNNNMQYCDSCGIRYISMEGNKGLSKAYNVAVDNSLESDIIVLFDDDTEVTEDYFRELRSSAETYSDVDIFAPVVIGQDGIIYSPNEFNFLRNHFISSVEQEVSQEAFNAIASCLAIRMRVFDDYRFNETLFMDQVDQYFFCEQRKLGRKFMKLNIKILQHFYQRGESLTPEAGWKRLRLRIFDIFRHARLMGGGKYLALALVKCCGLGAQIGKKSKSINVTGKACVLSLRLLIHAQ